MAAIPAKRVGVIGLGNIGRYHADRLQQLGQTIVGGVDVSEGARESFAETYETQAFSTFEDLYDHGVEALIITTPNKYHEEYAVAALERNIPVLVEKPLAHTLESAEQIVAAENDSEAFCMVGFHKRFLDCVEALKDRIDNHELGDIHHIEANYIRRRGIPGRGSWFTSDAFAGGGALIDIGVHVLDLAAYFLDFPTIRSVDATVQSEFGRRENYTQLGRWGDDHGSDRYDVDDSVRAFIQSTARTSISLNAAWAANQPDDTTITVTGSQGGARLDHETGELELYDAADSTEPQLLTTKVETRNTDPHRKEQRIFLEAVAEGSPPQRNTAEQGYYIQKLIDAIYTAGETGDRVPPTESTIPGISAD